MIKKPEDLIPLTKEQKQNAAANIREYVEKNFELNIGNMQSEFFLDFINEKIGVYFYNKAIADSQAFMIEKADDLYLLMKDEE
jgi:uncharacterized protein (DUF2164 family)